jgi:hypothetical protein
MRYFNFPEKTLVFPASQKIGTIFCPKGGLAVVNLKYFFNTVIAKNFQLYSKISRFLSN